jgi:L-malate glycosyltransferase
MPEVVQQLSERLAARGHDVTVVTRAIPERRSFLINGVKVVTFNIGNNVVRGLDGDVAGYEKFLLESDYDIVTFFAAQQWATDIALPILEKIRGKKVSVPTGYSGFYLPEYKAYFQQMKQWIHGFDMNVYLSNNYRDIDFARENGVRNMTIVPNGAAEDEFTAPSIVDVRKNLGLPSDTTLLLHVGSFTGWKGQHEAMEIFLSSNLENATLLMIGNHHEYFSIDWRKNPRLLFLNTINKLTRRKKIIFDSYSREFTVAAYRQADIFLFPSNIECSPIVLFECAAARLPFLSTDVGNTVEIAEWTKGGMILPTQKSKDGFSHADIKGSVKMLNELYANAELRKNMAETAHLIWKEKFSWEKIALQYEKIYQQLTSQ